MVVREPSAAQAFRSVPEPRRFVRLVGRVPRTDAFPLRAARRPGQNQRTQADVFKLDVQLYPDSWNTYDSLGEAYAAAGQKDLAIQNYEKSIQLNPKNDIGKQALAKLRGK